MNNIFDENKLKVVFPGLDGAPFRGQDIPNLKNNDRNQPQQVLDADIRIFKLNNEEHMIEYKIICDNCVKGLYVMGSEDKQWVPEEKTWYVFIRYYKRYTEMDGTAPVQKVKDHYTYRGTNV